jgi:hypothetical protein
MKDLSGPGIETISTGGEAGVGMAPGEGEEERHTRAVKKKANVRTWHFIIGYPWRTF